jgi:hypothetical protein
MASLKVVCGPSHWTILSVNKIHMSMYMNMKFDYRYIQYSTSAVRTVL